MNERWSEELGRPAQPAQLPVRGKVILIPIAFAIAQAILTVNFERVFVTSKIPFWAGVQELAKSLLFPGILGAEAILGLFDNTNLWLAAAINGLIYFGVGWGLTALVMHWKYRAQRSH